MGVLMAGPRVDVPDSRRARRRQETIDQVLDVSLAVMAESGAGGLSLGEVARRMGIRPPSLYQYFESKNAIYDALFAKGWRLLDELMARHETAAPAVTDAGRARAFTVDAAQAFVRWAVEHPVLAQLMFWRPVPGFVPTPASYAPAVDALDRLRAVVCGFVERGWLHPDAAGDEALDAYVVMVSGVISQHLANEPDATFVDGRFTALIPLLTDMFFDQFVPDRRSR
jgi:AcrR family transcriptional regulator